MFEIKGKCATAKVFAENVEESCIGQITKMVNHPAFTLPEGKHIAIMPDTHAGKGSVIGFTMPMTDKVVSNVVGVDLGCGMLASCFTRDKPFDFERIDRRIRVDVPMSTNVHFKPIVSKDDIYYFLDQAKEGTFERLCNKVGMDFQRAKCSIGTLGAGNHYVEIGKDTTGLYWVSVHSGSRQFGKNICEYWQKVATSNKKNKYDVGYEREIQRIREETIDKSKIPGLIAGLREERNIFVGPDELDHLEGYDMQCYLQDMYLAQRYASLNRRYMLRECLRILEPDTIIETLETVHNYINPDDHIIRKGAVRANKGERFILPLNMKDGTLICVGKGNPEWNYSAPHGAGRLMSRSEAKKRLDANLAKEEMEGIYTTCIPLDEAPGAYKSAESIESAIGDTATIEKRIKPILNIKAK